MNRETGSSSSVGQLAWPVIWPLSIVAFHCVPAGIKSLWPPAWTPVQKTGLDLNLPPESVVILKLVET